MLGNSYACVHACELFSTAELYNKCYACDDAFNAVSDVTYSQVLCKSIEYPNTQFHSDGRVNKLLNSSEWTDEPPIHVTPCLGVKDTT